MRADSVSMSGCSRSGATGSSKRVEPHVLDEGEGAPPRRGTASTTWAVSARDIVRIRSASSTISRSSSRERKPPGLPPNCRSRASASGLMRSCALVDEPRRGDADGVGLDARRGERRAQQTAQRTRRTCCSAWRQAPRGTRDRYATARASRPGLLCCARRLVADVVAVLGAVVLALALAAHAVEDDAERHGP